MHQKHVCKNNVTYTGCDNTGKQKIQHHHGLGDQSSGYAALWYVTIIEDESKNTEEFRRDHAEEYESLKVGMLERKYAHLIVRTQSLWLPYLQQKLRERGIENFPITEEIQTVWSITEKV